MIILTSIIYSLSDVFTWNEDESGESMGKESIGDSVG